METMLQPSVKVGVCGVRGCMTCKPTRVAHWFCAQCKGGPFRFSKLDAGLYRVQRPYSERTIERIVPHGTEGLVRKEYTIRRVCSDSCWQRERKNIANDEMELANHRPDLAPAIEAKLADEQAMDASGEFADDLGLAADPGSF